MSHRLIEDSCGVSIGKLHHINPAARLLHHSGNPRRLSHHVPTRLAVAHRQRHASVHSHSRFISQESLLIPTFRRCTAHSGSGYDALSQRTLNAYTEMVLFSNTKMLIFSEFLGIF